MAAPEPVSAVPKPVSGVDAGVENARQSARLQIAQSGTRDLDNFIAAVDKTAAGLSGALTKAVAQRGMATGEAADAVAAIANVQSTVATNAAQLKQQKLEEDMAWKQKIIQAREEANSRAATEFSALTERMREAARKQVDPNRFWASREIGQKVAITIGMILHDIGAGISGSNRRGIDILNTLIERDIQQQQQNIESSRALIDVDRFAFQGQQDVRTRGIDLMEARRVVAMDVIAQQLEINAALSDDEIIQQQAKIAVGELYQKQAEAVERAVTNKASVLMQAQGLIGGALEGSQRLAMSAMSGTGTERMPIEAVKEVSKAASMRRTAEELKANYEKFATDFYAPFTQFSSELGIESKAAEWRRYRGNVGLFVTNLLSGVQMPEAQVERITALIPNAGDTDATAFSKIRALYSELTGRASDIEKGLEWGGYPVGGATEQFSSEGFGQEVK
jgi:hypothetical protein